MSRLKVLNLFFLVALFGCQAEKVTSPVNNIIPTVNIIPKPTQVKNHELAPINVKQLVIMSDDATLAEYTVNKIKQVSSVTARLVSSDEDILPDDTLVMLINSNKTPEHESYVLNISQNQISISSGSTTGMFYGVQSLLQIISANTQNEQLTLPQVNINDKPRFGWRGMHLDVSRHFFGVEFVKQYLDALALHKMNVFHWHLTDDQGWRIEIDSYPKLTEIGAWRKGSASDKWSFEVETAVEGEPKYGGFYTKKEVREIVEYAGKLHITVVPEIELPGHSWAALSAYPELSCSGIPWKKPADVAFEFSDPFCVGNPETFVFFEKVFTEIFELFPSQYIHLGGDEAKHSPWENCEACLALMKEHDLKNMAQVQTYFVNRVANFIQSNGRKVIGWDEVAEENNKTDLAIMSWRGTEPGIEALKKGHKVVFASNEAMYFDKPQNTQGNADEIANLKAIMLEDVYHYDPLNEGDHGELSPALIQNVLGIQGQLWTEYVYSEKIAFKRLLPRLSALAEAAWSEPKNKDFADFLARLENHYQYLDKNNLSYYSSPVIGLIDDKVFIEPFNLTLSTHKPSSTIYYTLDGSVPTTQSIQYESSIVIEKNTSISVMAIDEVGNQSNVISATYQLVDYKKALDVNPINLGLQANTYLGKIQTLDDFHLLTPQKTYIAKQFTIPSGVPEDDFALSFNGYIKIPSNDIYTFTLSSDDGSRLYIDDELLVDYDGQHGMGEVSGMVALKKGFHKISLKYFEAIYGQGLEVYVEGNSLDKQLVNESQLFH